MRRQLLLAFLSIVGMVLTYGIATAESPIATPAIDPTIFKDGAVESREFSFGEWHAKCQEIVKVKRRICNLLSSVADASRRNIGSILIATTDTGIPAMIVALPLVSSQNKLLRVEASQSGKLDVKAVRVEYTNTVKSMICDTSCKFMFPLDPRLVFILNAGDNAQIRLQSAAAATDSGKRKPARPEEKSPEEIYTVNGRGFAETLAQSTKPW